MCGGHGSGLGLPYIGTWPWRAARLVDAVRARPSWGAALALHGAALDFMPPMRSFSSWYAGTRCWAPDTSRTYREQRIEDGDGVVDVEFALSRSVSCEPGGNTI